MGGRLTICDPIIGEYTIERFDEVQKGTARCYTRDGQAFGEDWLKDRLQGMTKEVYQSVYSFSALDLNDIKQMKDEDIGEVLLGIGLTGANNIYHIEKKLDQKIGELFKPTGKIPVINQQLESLDERLNLLMNYKKNESTYQDKQQQVNMIHTEIDELQIKLQEAKESMQLNERYLNNLSMINDYHLYQKQLEHYPMEIKFPEDGVERFNLLKGKLLPLQSELSILQANVEKIKTEQTKLQEQQLAEYLYEEAQTILLSKAEYHANIREREKIAEEIKTLHVKLETMLDELNTTLTLEDLEHISLPFYLEEKWNELRIETDRLNFEGEQLQQEQTGLKKQQTFLLDQVEALEKELLTSEQLEEIYLQIDEYKEFAYRNKLQEETFKQQLKWKKEKQNKKKQMYYLLIGSFILALFTGVIGFTLNYSFLYNLTAVIVMLGIGQWLLGKRGIKETSDLLNKRVLSEDHSISITETEKKAAEEALAEYDENIRTLSSLKDQLQSIDVKFIQLNERKRGWQRRSAKLDAQLEDQIKHYPFLQTIDINYWREFYHTLKQSLSMLQEKQGYQIQIEKINEKTNAYTNIVSRYLKEIDQPLSMQSLSFQLETIEDMVRKHGQTEQTKERLKQEIVENISQQEHIVHQMDVYEKEIQKLFMVAQVDSEEEFLKKDKIRFEKEELEEKIHKMSDQLQLIFSQKAWKELSENKPDQSKLERELQQEIERIQTIEASIYTAQQRIADLHADLAKMESSEVYSQTMHQFTMEKEELAKLAKKWAVFKTAKEMLVETKKKYREKYLTDVIHKTSVYFQKITNQSYVNIIPPREGKPFQVETANHIRYEVNELSQGTINQLYICLRLAISEIMSKEHHVPFMIDDAFVHFDASRTKRIMDVLTEIAKDQQIILFTCKKEVANSLSESHIVQLGSTI